MASGAGKENEISVNQVEFQVPLGCQGAVESREVTDPQLPMTINQAALLQVKRILGLTYHMCFFLGRTNPPRLIDLSRGTLLSGLSIVHTAGAPAGSSGARRQAGRKRNHMGEVPGPQWLSVRAQSPVAW